MISLCKIVWVAILVMLLSACAISGQPLTSTSTDVAVTRSTSPVPTQNMVPLPTPTRPSCPAHRILFYKNKSIYLACFDNSTTYFEYKLMDSEGGPILSPKGEYLSSDDGVVHRLFDLLGRETSTLGYIEHMEDMYWYTWSPDGEYVAYGIFTPGGELIRVMFVHIPTQTVSNTFISSQTLGYSMYEHIIFPTWSPDGKQIALYDQSLFAVFLVEIICSDITHQCETVGNAREISSPDFAIYGPVSWSPDGAKVAAICRSRNEGKITTTLCVLDMDGRVVQEFNITAFDVEDPDHVRWSPSGDLIAFQGAAGHGESAIYILFVEDMSVYAILSAPGQHYQMPMWVP
jgi:hypothetical protein